MRKTRLSAPRRDGRRAGCRAARRRTRLAPRRRSASTWEAPGNVGEVADALDDARRGEQRVRVLCELFAREVVEEGDRLVVERVLRLDEHAELARRSGLRVEHVQVLDHLRLLVDPLDRVGLQHELALDRETTREDRRGSRSRAEPRPAVRAIRARRRAGRAVPRGSRGPSSATCTRGCRAPRACR